MAINNHELQHNFNHYAQQANTLFNQMFMSESPETFRKHSTALVTLAQDFANQEFPNNAFAKNSTDSEQTSVSENISTKELESMFDQNSEQTDAKSEVWKMLDHFIDNPRLWTVAESMIMFDTADDKIQLLDEAVAHLRSVQSQIRMINEQRQEITRTIMTHTAKQHGIEIPPGSSMEEVMEALIGNATEDNNLEDSPGAQVQSIRTSLDLSGNDELAQQLKKILSLSDDAVTNTEPDTDNE